MNLKCWLGYRRFPKLGIWNRTHFFLKIHARRSTKILLLTYNKFNWVLILSNLQRLSLLRQWRHFCQLCSSPLSDVSEPGDGSDDYNDKHDGNCNDSNFCGRDDWRRGSAVLSARVADIVVVADICGRYCHRRHATRHPKWELSPGCRANDEVFRGKICCWHKQRWVRKRASF